MQPTDPVIQRMLDLAKDASTRAYAPYSRFPVGAAVLTASGATFAAANVENASLGLTMCAERSAVAQAVGAGHTRLSAVVVYAPTARPCPPCGACRQVIHEFGPDAEVFSFAENGECLRATIRDLLPHAFQLDDLTEVRSDGAPSGVKLVPAIGRRPRRAPAPRRSPRGGSG